MACCNPSGFLHQRWQHYRQLACCSPHTQSNARSAPYNWRLAAAVDVLHYGLQGSTRVSVLSCQDQWPLHNLPAQDAHSMCQNRACIPLSPRCPLHSPALVHAQCPVWWHGWCPHHLMVLPDHSLRGGTQEEVQVNQPTNHPAGQQETHIGFS
jgi:hypothetical protein